MPGVSQTSVVRCCAMRRRSGARSRVCCCSNPRPQGRGWVGAWIPRSVQDAVRELKRAVRSGGDITDVCMCEYTDHGHCGVLGVRTSTTMRRWTAARTAVSHPGGCRHRRAERQMDGRVAAIRRALDAADRSETIILSDALKYASAFYGPFREARRVLRAARPARLSDGPPTRRGGCGRRCWTLPKVRCGHGEAAGPYLDTWTRVKAETATARVSVSGESYVLLRPSVDDRW